MIVVQLGGLSGRPGDQAPQVGAGLESTISSSNVQATRRQASPSQPFYWWRSTGAGPVYVTLSVDDGPEEPFAEGVQGRKEIPGYRSTSRYTFNVYSDSERGRLIDSKSYGPN